jgi:hypothetical protein
LYPFSHFSTLSLFHGTHAHRQNPTACSNTDCDPTGEFSTLTLQYASECPTRLPSGRWREDCQALGLLMRVIVLICIWRIYNSMGPMACVQAPELEWDFQESVFLCRWMRQLKCTWQFSMPQHSIPLPPGERRSQSSQSSAILTQDFDSSTFLSDFLLGKMLLADEPGTCMRRSVHVPIAEPQVFALHSSKPVVILQCCSLLPSYCSEIRTRVAIDW